MEPTAQLRFDSRAMTARNHEWQRFHCAYVRACAKYQRTREAADLRPLNLASMTAAFLAEERARERLVLSARPRAPRVASLPSAAPLL